MNSKLKIALVLLFFIALFVINNHYVCGHKQEDLFHSETCQICELFLTTELIPLVNYFIVFIGIFTAIEYIYIKCSFSLLSIYLTTISCRAPLLVK